MKDGYAAERRLATLRKLAKLVYQAGVIDREQHAMILTVQTPTGAEGRSKVGKTQLHRLTTDALAAVQRWLAADAPAARPLLRGSRKGGKLSHGGLSERAAYDVVQRYGAVIGVEELSPHDLRHTWATRAAETSSVFALRDAGGWTSLAMPNHCVAAGAIANEGVVLRY